MKSVNKVFLLGNVGKDPEVKYTNSGTAMARFSLATSERFKNRSGEWEDKTEWHNIVAWQKLAEIVKEYAPKGTKLHIEGRLQTSSWDDKKTGDKKYKTEIVAEDITLLGSKSERHDSISSGQDRTPEPTVVDEDIPF